MTQITYNLPAVWAPYLVNGDRDALVFEAGHTQEIDLIDEWLQREELGSCLSCSQTPCFTWKPDGPVGLGAESLKFTFALHTGSPPPRQCWVCVPPVIALKTREPLVPGLLQDGDRQLPIRESDPSS